MVRLIDADALLDTTSWLVFADNKADVAYVRVADIMQQPTIEAVPVVHGHWRKDRLVSTGGGTYGVRRCSACEWYCEDLPYWFNYCPHCGAKMDEVSDGKV